MQERQCNIYTRVLGGGGVVMPEGMGESPTH